jgi:acyl carrier protein
MAHSGPDDLDATVRAALVEIAPDLDTVTIDPDADFHDDLGLDSMDTLNLAIALDEATGIDIPERDYRHITSITNCLTYLRGRQASRPD